MQVIGFNFTKVSAEREPQFKRNFLINTHIEFTNVEKNKNELIDNEITKLFFKYSLTYNDRDNKEKKQGEVSFEGIILLSTSKDEAKKFQKSWKKKEIPKEYMPSLYNLILKRCSIRAVQLEDEVGLPAFQLRVPQVKPPRE